MNPILLALAALAQFKTDFKAKVNVEMAKLKPLEQHELAEPVKSVLWTADWASRRLEELGTEWDDTIKKADELVAAMKGEAGQEAISAALEAGDLIKKEDHVNLLAEAKNEGKTEAQTEFAEQEKKRETVAARRKELVEKVGELAAAAVTDEQLLEDSYQDLTPKIEARVGRLGDIGITAESKPAAFKTLASIPVTAEGEKEFDNRLPSYAEFAKSVPAVDTKRPATPTLATGAPDGSEKGKRRFAV